jgi:small subunit ribosomal protein S4e
VTHQKRLSAPKHYPIDRKDEKYVATIRGSRDADSAIPAGLFLRDVLEYADTEKEAKEIIRNGDILRNGEEVRDVQEGVGVLDIVEIPETGEKFRVIKNGDNLDFVPVENNEVFGKIVGKSQEDGELVYRLHSGENYRTNDDFQTGSTLVFGSGVEEIELEEGAEVIVIRGKHAGETAEVEEIVERGMNDDTAIIENDTTFETQLENLVAVTGVEVTE